MDIGHIDTVLETLNQACYYLNATGRRYRFSLSPNLNKLLADRRASISGEKIDERVRAEVKKVFAKGEGFDIKLFVEESGNVPDRPALTLAVLPPERTMDDADATKKQLDAMTRECSRSARTYKTAIIWSVANSTARLKDEARKLLAWEDIQSEEDVLRLDDGQKEKLADNVNIAQKSIREAVWQAYNTIVLLGKDNTLKVADLGLIHSSSNESLPGLILAELIKTDDVVKSVSPNSLTRKWPGFVEWSTRAVRDVFYASPQFPRLLHAEAVKETIARGVSEGLLAYVGRRGHGRYEPFIFKQSMAAQDVEISDDVYIITAEEAVKHIEPQRLTAIVLFPDSVSIRPGDRVEFRPEGRDQHGRAMALAGAVWTAAGGTILPVGSNGAFTAGDQVGMYAVEVTAGDVKGGAAVMVTTEPASGAPGRAGASQDGTSTVQGGGAPTQAGAVASVQWTGQVPSAKWMQFYTKVLAKHVRDQNLTLGATFTIRPEQGLSKQEVDEIRAALSELDLDNNVRTE